MKLDIARIFLYTVVIFAAQMQDCMAEAKSTWAYVFTAGGKVVTHSGSAEICAVSDLVAHATLSSSLDIEFEAVVTSKSDKTSVVRIRPRAGDGSWQVLRGKLALKSYSGGTTSVDIYALEPEMSGYLVISTGGLRSSSNAKGAPFMFFEKCKTQ
jgi:hypothetical protein